MQETSRLRLWFWLMVVPAGAIFILTILLRQSAQIAADKRLEQEYAEQRAAGERAQADREAERLGKQKTAGERCARLARSMLEARSDDALLILVTPPHCDVGCDLVASANRVTEQYAGLGLRGLWVATAQQRETRAPTPSAMKRIVVPDCSAFLSGRQSDFIVLGRDGSVVHHGLAAAGPMHYPRESNDATLLDAVRSGMATR